MVNESKNRVKEEVKERVKLEDLEMKDESLTLEYLMENEKDNAKNPKKQTSPKASKMNTQIVDTPHYDSEAELFNLPTK